MRDVQGLLDPVDVANNRSILPDRRKGNAVCADTHGRLIVAGPLHTEPAPIVQVYIVERAAIDRGARQVHLREAGLVVAFKIVAEDVGALRASCGILTAVLLLLASATGGNAARPETAGDSPAQSGLKIILKNHDLFGHDRGDERRG